MHSIPKAELGFFRGLHRLVFANAFSAPREALLGELVPDTPIETLRRDEEALSRLVAAKMARFDKEGRARVAGVREAERELVENAYTYLAYHRSLPHFDRLIERQLAGESDPVVSFLAPILEELEARGIGEADAARYVAFFYQLRRAYHFIGRALVGWSPSMVALRVALWNSVFTHDMLAYKARLWNRMEDFSTLLLGETGTGKGQAAAAIGRSAFIPFLPRERRFAANFTRTFVALNLSQFPETLIESELFGHRKGAFTGAIEDHQGMLELCSAHGALFLDEIGEIGVPVQIKLLRVLQERTFTPLGTHAVKRFNGRVVAATNHPLAELRAQGFRDDFFYRLCSDVIVLPPLRQRIEESPKELWLMVDSIVGRMTGGRDAATVERVLAALERDLPAGYRWPGNVRELEQAVRRILVTGGYAGNTDPAAADEEEEFTRRARTGDLAAEELLAGYCALLYRRHGTYEEVARRAGLDRRTAKKYVQAAAAEAR